MLIRSLYLSLTIIQIILVLEYYILNKKWKKKLRVVEIDESLINTNIDKWENLCIFGKINGKDIYLLINDDSITLNYENSYKEIRVNNYNISSDRLLIDDCLTIYKKDNNMKITLSIDNTILYFDLDESCKILFKEELDHYLMSESIKIKNTSFIMKEEKEELDDINLLILRYQKEQPILLWYRDWILITESNILFKDSEKIVREWKLYEDCLIYFHNKEIKITNLNEYIKNIFYNK